MPEETSDWPAWALCGCDCHAGCPLDAAADDKGWPENCTCNATVAMRQRGPEVGFVAAVKQIASTSHRQRHARHAAEDRGAGLSATQIAEIVNEEWASRGLDPPVRLAMDRTVDLIARPPGVVEQVRDRARIGFGLLGLPVRLRRATNGGLAQIEKRVGRDRGRVFEIAGGGGAVEVHLYPGSATDPDRLADGALLLPSQVRAAKVVLRIGDGGSIEVSGHTAPGDALAAGLPIGTIGEWMPPGSGG